MKILHLVTGRGPTGPAAAAMSDVKALLAAGHSAYIAVKENALMQACASEGLPCVGGLKLGRGAFRLIHLPHDVRRLREIIRELSIDVLHVHRSDDQLLAALSLGRSLTATLVRTWHRDPNGVPRLLLGKLARQADGCVCVSRQHATALLANGAKAAEFLDVAVDTTVFCPSQMEQTSAAASTTMIGQVGRWKRGRDGADRGQQAALDVFDSLSTKLSWKGILIGRGEMGAALRHEAFTERGLSPQRIEILDVPKQSPADFARLLSSLSLGLVFNAGSDGTSRAGAELLSCGVPLLVADLPGLRELADDNSCALRQLPNDPQGWARTIEQLLTDNERLQQMRVAARQRAEKTHAMNVRGAALAEFYKAIRMK